MTKQLTVLLLTGLLSLGTCTATATADEVTDWNQMMLRVALLGGTTPLALSRNAAIVQASV